MQLLAAKEVNGFPPWDKYIVHNSSSDQIKYFIILQTNINNNYSLGISITTYNYNVMFKQYNCYKQYVLLCIFSPLHHFIVLFNYSYGSKHISV